MGDTLCAHGDLALPHIPQRRRAQKLCAFRRAALDKPCVAVPFLHVRSLYRRLLLAAAALGGDTRNDNILLREIPAERVFADTLFTLGDVRRGAEPFGCTAERVKQPQKREERLIVPPPSTMSPS